MRRGQRRSFSSVSDVGNGVYENTYRAQEDDVLAGQSGIAYAIESQGRRTISPSPISGPPFAVIDTLSASSPPSRQLSLHMVSDKEYHEFLLSGRRKRNDRKGMYGTNCGPDDAGRCCAGFSLVAMIFLVSFFSIDHEPMDLSWSTEESGVTLSTLIQRP